MVILSYASEITRALVDLQIFGYRYDVHNNVANILTNS